MPEKNQAQNLIKKSVYVLEWIAKYALPRPNIYDNSYLEQVYYSSSDTYKEITFINQFIPDSAPISINIPISPLEYGLFGKNKSRNLFPVQDISQVESGYFIGSSSLGILPSDHICLLGDNGNYSVFFVFAP